MKKIAIIGFDDLGQAFAKLLSRNSPDTEIWAHTFIDKVISMITKKHTNPNFGEVYNVNNLVISYDIHKVVRDSDLVVIACDLKDVDLYINKVIESIETPTEILILRKGNFPGTTQSLRSYIAEMTAQNPFIVNICSLVGSFKNRLLYNNEAQIATLLGPRNEQTLRLKKTLTNEKFKVYISTDIVETELWTNFSEVLQMFAGILEELKVDKNTSLTLMTRYIREIQNLLHLLGLEVRTFTSTAVFPMIWKSTFDETQKNFILGRDIIKLGKRALNSKKPKVPIDALKYIKQLMDDKNLVMPFTNTLYKLLFKDFSPKQAERYFFQLNVTFEDQILYLEKEEK